MKLKRTRKITYAAVCAALAAICIIAAKFLPLKFTPLMLASVCFFVALQCGFGLGLFSMAAAMLLSFFWGGIDLTVLLTGFLFAPYSIIAYFIQKLTYKKPVQAVVRAGIVTVVLNAALAAIVFGFFDIPGQLLLGLELSGIFKESVMPWMYIIAATAGTFLAVGFDVMFVTAWKVINKRLKIKEQNV